MYTQESKSIIHGTLVERGLLIIKVAGKRYKSLFFISHINIASNCIFVNVREKDARQPIHHDVSYTEVNIIQLPRNIRYIFGA